MGRYYYGDIQGKFMFAVQSSEALSRFGTSPMLSYSYSEDDIENVTEELKQIEKDVDINKVVEFFKERDYYSDNDLQEANINSYELKEYADWKLGKQLLSKLEEQGECNIECEI